MEKEIYLYEFKEGEGGGPKILISNDLEILVKAESTYKILVSEYPGYLKSIINLDIYVVDSKEKALEVADYLYYN